MFKFNEICELIRLVGSTRVGSVEIEHGGSRVRIEGAGSVASDLSVRVAPPADVPVFAPAPGTAGSARHGAVDAGAEAAPEDEGLHMVTSPIVGTFYRAPSPDADPYVKVGEQVEKGQVLCIVEAMKLMNEIESDRTGTVVKVLAENAQPVEFGQALFALRLS